MPLNTIINNLKEEFTNLIMLNPKLVFTNLILLNLKDIFLLLITKKALNKEEENGE